MPDNVFRSAYRALTEQEKAQIVAIKTSAAVMLNSMLENSREMALARTKLEESVMWATKAITG